jgi:hypothetical protein
MTRNLGVFHVVDHHRLEEALGLQVVHQIVGVEERLMASRALAPAEEDLLVTFILASRKRTGQERQQIDACPIDEISPLRAPGRSVGFYLSSATVTGR